MSHSRSFRVTLLICSLVLLLLAQLFNAAQNMSSFKKLLVSSLAGRYPMLTTASPDSPDLHALFEPGEAEPDRLNRFLETLRLRCPEVASAAVARPDGTVLDSTGGWAPGAALPDALQFDSGSGQGRRQALQPVTVVSWNGRHHALLPVNGSRNVRLGILVLSLDEEVLGRYARAVLDWNLKILAAISLAAAAVLALCLVFFVSLDAYGRFPLVRTCLVLICILGSAQLLYAGASILHLRNYYAQAVRSNALQVVAALGEAASRRWQGSAEQVPKAEVISLAHQVMAHMAQVKAVRILDPARRLLYDPAADPDEAARRFHPASGRPAAEPGGDRIHAFTVPITGSQGLLGYIHVELSPAVMDKITRSIIWDSLTVVLVSVLFAIELVLVLVVLIHKKMDLVYQQQDEIDDSGFYLAIRPVAFLFLFSMDLTISFIPLYMRDLYRPMAGLSQTVAMGLPISTEMAFAALTILLAAGWVDRKGWHQVFFAGVSLAALGNLFSGSAAGPIGFVVSRAVVGLGYGLCFIAFQSFVLSNTQPRKRARGMSNLGAGIIAGSVCGAAAGAVLADRIGYGPVFYVSGGLLSVVVVFVAVLFRDTFTAPPATAGARAPGPALRRAGRFLLDRNILSLLVFNAIPNALCLTGFLYFLTPVYLDGMGVSKSDIGRVLMIYGLCQIYLGPAIGRVVDRSDHKKLFIAASGVLCGLSYAVFDLFGGFLTTVMVVFMMGISSSFGYSSRIVFALNVKATREFGEGRAVSVYRFVERLGQVVGPLALGWMIGPFGIESSMGLVGSGFLVLTLGFMLAARQEQREGLEQDEIDALLEQYRPKRLTQQEVDTLLAELL